MMDVGVYPIFSVRNLTGQRLQSVAAMGTVRQLHGLTDCDSLVFTFLLQDGTPGVIEAGFTYLSSLIELEGSHGRLTIEGHITQAVQGRVIMERWLQDGGTLLSG
ncbi:Gfo/Idh/MocA family protein [Thermobaculum terrenum]|uniref:Gfo/Idh/MocA family protein n=1 Tax=Thermobaculum terrenum TaxID=166501 RepID=UPI00019C0635|nr:hypothetical protein [Thermobaculum terrenum]